MVRNPEAPLPSLPKLENDRVKKKKNTGGKLRVVQGAHHNDEKKVDFHLCA